MQSHYEFQNSGGCDPTYIYWLAVFGQSIYFCLSLYLSVCMHMSYSPLGPSVDTFCVFRSFLAYHPPHQ